MKHPLRPVQKPNYLLRIVLIIALIAYIIVYVSSGGMLKMPNNSPAAGAEE